MIIARSLSHAADTALGRWVVYMKPPMGELHDHDT